MERNSTKGEEYLAKVSQPKYRHLEKHGKGKRSQENI
jgi:hypothetical protein